VRSLARLSERRRGQIALALAGGALLIGPGALLSAEKASAACPNEALREERHLTFLPDCRAYEMVSPTQKNGGEVAAPGAIAGGALLQASSSGQESTFSSAASFGPEAKGAPLGSQYLSHRTPSGWVTENITLSTPSGAYGEEPDGVSYRAFSEALERGILLDGRRCIEVAACPLAYTLRESDGTLWPSPEAAGMRFLGASRDLRHVILSTCEALTPDAVEVPLAEGCDPSKANLYEWVPGDGLTLVNLRPGDSTGTPGATLAASAGAVSEDGDRVYWADPSGLYLREGGVTKWVDEAAGGGGAFQDASADGAIAFFTKAGHLWRYDAGSDEATDLTPSGGVTGVLGASPDGTPLYYQDGVALKRWRNGASSVLAPGAEAAAPSNFPPATGTARVNANGNLAFISEAPLTGYDNTDVVSGEPDSQVFLYQAAKGTLTCASCRPSGTRPRGHSSIPGALANGSTQVYKPRALSANGERLYFDSNDALLSQDTNNRPDVYEWQAQGQGSCTSPGGCLRLISSGRDPEGAAFVDASASGADVFFLTSASLLLTDPGSLDLYDAREGGSFPEPPSPIPCVGDACQPLPSPPLDPTPGTLVPTRGNAAVRFEGFRCPKGKRAVTRHGKRRCVQKHKRSAKQKRRARRRR
jgi:hypothetical protein